MPLITSGLNRSFGAGSRPFTITSVSQLPNLEVGYIAGSIDATTFNSGLITSGTAVTSWHNTGGVSSHDWNSTGGSRPEWYSNLQNGRGSVRFNGTTAGTPVGEDADTDENLTINPVTYLQSLGGATQIIGFRSLSTNSGIRYCCSTDVNGFQWGQDGTTWIGGFAGATFTVDTLVADTNFHIVTMWYDGSQTGNANRLRVRLDGVPATLTFTGTVDTVTSALAKYFYGGATGTSATNQSNFWVGDIGELLIWTRTLASSEITAAEDYLMNYWGV